MGHRRFLHGGHKFRMNKIRFNGEQELRTPPKLLTGEEIFEQVKDIDVTFGRPMDSQLRGKRRRGGSTSTDERQQWRKKSIFFELPYWKQNLLRHNLDVMHIEKNVCDNILFTLLNDSSRSKDHLNARKDLRDIGCKPDLWPDENGKFAPAVYTMSKQGKKLFLNTLKNICVPDSYASNISRCIDANNLKIVGTLKSHDSHILLQQLLPLAMRAGVDDKVSAVLLELCSFFRQICGKTLNVMELDNLQNQIVLTLCHMEMLFPPSFFTLMIHLIVHLVDEAKLGGPVYYRWMYPIERYLGLLKSYVRNKANPEGSIAECYIAQEVITFCSRYLDDIETVWNRPRRVDDESLIPQHQNARIAELFSYVGKPVGGFMWITLSSIEHLQAHRHVLINCPAIDSYVQEFRVVARRQLRSRSRNPIEVDKMVHREFRQWFANRINRDREVLPESDKSLLIALAQGPIKQAKRYTAFNVNGYKFRTLERDRGLNTQNSGVFGTFGTRSYSSNSDVNMRYGGVPYYGKLVDIIDINYNGLFTVTLFKCEWANTTTPRGLKTDKLVFTSISFARPIHTGLIEDDEPYIKASEAQMVFYVDDQKEDGWCIPIHIKPRDLYDMGEDNLDAMANIEAYPSQNLESLFSDEDRPLPLSRDDEDDLHNLQSSNIGEQFESENNI